ncbi:hypothetical protein G9A89_021535 [Geosiphon pyriformis]|nr:hypothetical protein G9A89_021535 [Geosiphon pyriformis]
MAIAFEHQAMRTPVNTESARETFYKELIQNTNLPTNHNFASIITEINKEIKHHTQQRYPITYTSKGKRKLQTPAVTPRKTQSPAWKKNRVESPSNLLYHYTPGSAINISSTDAFPSTVTLTFGRFSFQICTEFLKKITTVEKFVTAQTQVTVFKNFREHFFTLHDENIEDIFEYATELRRYNKVYNKLVNLIKANLVLYEHFGLNVSPADCQFEVKDGFMKHCVYHEYKIELKTYAQAKQCCSSCNFTKHVFVGVRYQVCPQTVPHSLVRGGSNFTYLPMHLRNQTVNTPVSRGVRFQLANKTSIIIDKTAVIDRFIASQQSVFIATALMLHPAIISWVGGLADIYDKYNFMSLQIRYIPIINTNTSSNAFITFDYDDYTQPATQLDVAQEYYNN